jgi:hypothetical protein
LRDFIVIENSVHEIHTQIQLRIHFHSGRGRIVAMTTYVTVANADFFLIGIVEGGVQLGPLGTAATNRPIVPALGDYGDGEIGGMMIGRGNRSILRKPAPVPLCLPHRQCTRYYNDSFT